MKLNSSIFFAKIGAVLCVACCAAIPLATMLGFTAVAGLSGYFHLASGLFLLLSLGFIGYALYAKKHKSCGSDCSCAACRA